MPILIKGSGGAQKMPEITVRSSGLITATAGKKKAELYVDLDLSTVYCATAERTSESSITFNLSNYGELDLGSLHLVNGGIWKNNASQEISGNDIVRFQGDLNWVGYETPSLGIGLGRSLDCFYDSTDKTLTITHSSARDIFVPNVTYYIDLRRVEYRKRANP